MIRSTPLAQTELVQLVRLDHPRDEVHHDPPTELSDAYAVNFVESGAFELTMARKTWAVHTAAVLLSTPLSSRRYSHSEETPGDVVLSIEYARAAAETMFARAARKPSTLVIPLTNRLSYLRARLLPADGSHPSALETDSTAAELFLAIVEGPTANSRLHRPNQLRWYAHRMDQLRHLLEERHADSHNLHDLGRRVGMSPFHMARTFRELVGVSPHRYLVDIRLREAARRLRDGEAVTDTCFAVGFCDLSNFIRSFRRKFGVSPSRYGS
jgi:AraC family transcriptional regulator